MIELLAGWETRASCKCLTRVAGHVLCADSNAYLSPLVTELGLERYKFVVQVVIGEHKGEGVR